MDETYRLVYESVDQDIFGEFMITPLTHGAVASHPNLPFGKISRSDIKAQRIQDER